MIVDIFIKTWAADEPWMFYCLRFLAKNARGFRRIVVVNDGEVPGTSFDVETPLELVVVASAPRPPAGAADKSHHGVGYVWQQAVKLCWTDFSDAEAACILDSDMMVTAPISPETFLVDGRPMWWRRPWAEAGRGVIHKPAADHFVGQETAFDYMPGPCFFYTREAALGLRRFMLERHGQDPYSYVTDPRRPAPSEYQMVGAYLDHVDRHGYEMREPRELTPLPYRTLQDWPIHQFWSWGTVEKMRPQLEELLR